MNVYIVKTLGVPTIILGVFDDEKLASSYSITFKPQFPSQIAVSVHEVVSYGSPKANEIMLS
jgi:hypothetical protein